MEKKQLEDILREIYRLWNIEGTEEDIDYILGQVINKIGK